MTTRSTDKDDDYAYLLAQSPQEWKWLLQDEGLMEDSDETESALNSLQRMGHDLQNLERQMHRANNNQNHTSMRMRHSLQQQHEQQQLLSDMMPTDFDITTTTSLEDDMDKYMTETVEPSCRIHIQNEWTKHKDSVQEIFECYQKMMQTSELSVEMHTIRKALALTATAHDDDDDGITGIGTGTCIEGQLELEDYQQIVMDLKELQSFCHERTRVQKSIPSFMISVLGDEWNNKSTTGNTTHTTNGNNNDYESKLGSLLHDMRPFQFHWWVMWHDSIQRNIWISHWDKIRRKARDLMVQEEEKHHAQELELQVQVDECQSNILFLKTKLQTKITSLFDFEDEIEIVM